jgi:predicted aldo/keto reductase-like oxidoreductase
LNKKKLTQGDLQRLERYALKTGPGYCAGCANVCESLVDLDIPISDLLRYSMYYYSYGDRERAQTLYRDLSTDIRNNILKADYSTAEKFCPQKIQIGKAIKKAHEDLA